MLRRNLLIMSGVAAAALVTGCNSSKTSKDIFEVVRDNSDLSVLGDALISAGLDTTLQTAGSYTLFAPNNAAFVALLAELALTKDQLFANKPLLTSVLTYHLLPGEVAGSDLPLNTPLATVQGSTLSISNVAGILTITDGRSRTSRIIQVNLEAKNGVIHVLDKVLLPPV